MTPIVAEASQVILVAVREEVDVSRLVLLTVLEVVHAYIRVGDVTHCVFCVVWRSERRK